jgi:hypothetical protein
MAKVTFEDLAKRAPIESPDDFMGKEHFRVYGNACNLTYRLSSTIFGQLVNPTSTWGLKKSGRRIESVYSEHGIIIESRERAGLEPLPKHLTPEKSNHSKFTYRHVIAAGSVIYLAGKPEIIEVVYGLGAESQEGLELIVSKVKHDIQNPRLPFDEIPSPTLSLDEEPEPSPDLLVAHWI